MSLEANKPNLSRLGYGASAIMGIRDERDRQNLLAAAFDAGITHFDVARSYGLGRAERSIGRFAASRRSAVTITTKFGIFAQPLPEAIVTRTITRLPGPIGHNNAVTRFVKHRNAMRRNRFSLEDLHASVNTSLASLGSDYIDVLLCHELALEDASDALLETLRGLVTAGKIRYFGVGTTLSNIGDLAVPYPELVQLAQFENSALRPQLQRLPAATDYAVTHRALSESFTLIRKRLSQEAARETARTEVGVDLAADGVLAGVMLQYALDANPDGTILFSTRRAANLRANAQLAHERRFDAETVSRFAIWASAERPGAEQ